MKKNSIFVVYNDFASERLIEATKDLCVGRKDKIHIFDMGTGNGYIAISLFLDGYTNIEASDASKFSVKLTKSNQNRNSIKFPVYHSDLFDKLSGLYDIIIFNISPISTPLVTVFYFIKNLF